MDPSKIFGQRALQIVALCMSLLGAMSSAHAQAPSALDSLILRAAPSEAREVSIGVQVHQIEFVNQKAENFGVVATLRLEWDDPELAFDPAEFGRDFKLFTLEAFTTFVDKHALFLPGFVLSNQQGRRLSQIARVLVFSNGHAAYFERFSVTLQAPDFNFVQYPFDTQKFFVRVESTYPEAFVKFVPLPGFSKIDKKLGEEEWVNRETWTEVATSEGITGLPSSRFSFGARADRHLEYYVVRIFAPLVIFVIVSWATFFLQEYRKRIDIASGNLLIFVAFNFAISRDLPHLGYITFLDFIMVAMFMMTGLIIVFNVVLRRLKVHDHEDLARRIDRHVLFAIYPLAYALILAVAIYLYQYRPSLLLEI